MRQLLFPEPPSARASIALLFLRLIAGIGIAMHGWGKIQNPFHWMDGAASPAPAVFQALAALSEFGGGIALALGLLTPIAAAGVLSTMVVAAFTHMSKGDPFIGKGGSWELAAIYGSIAAVLGTIGPGAFSLDALIRARAAKN